MFLRFPQPLILATFLARPQRFLAEVLLADGTKTIAYCANPGSLGSILPTGSAALLWDSGDELRKRRFTWRGIKLGKVWVGTDTHLANSIVEQLLLIDLLPSFRSYERIERELLVQPGFRIDFLLSGTGPPCYLEVKTSVVVEDGIARFPDSVTPRGLKHLERLIQLAQKGHRAVLLFVVQRNDAQSFAINAKRHPAYAEMILKAVAAGVELLAVAVEVKPEGFCKPRILPFG